MFRKLITAVLVCMLIFTLAIPLFADVFTDVDSYTSFDMNGNPVWNAGETVGDYWVGEWDSGIVMAESKIAIEQGKGWDSTAAIALWEEGSDANQGMYLFITPNNAINGNYSGKTYLRVWMDLSNVAFRKANFGVTDAKYNLFTTDEENSAVSEWPFYYKADGSDTWTTMYHGGDGCFGDAQDSDVAGFKGFFVFPVSDFVVRKNDSNKSGLADDTAADMANVTSLYLFWDYSDNNADLVGNKFYIDNIEFVTDYKVFDGIIYDPPIIEEIAPVESPAPAASATVSAPVVTATTAPQTFDGLTITFAMLMLSAMAVKLIKKRR